MRDATRLDPIREPSDDVPARRDRPTRAGAPPAEAQIADLDDLREPPEGPYDPNEAAALAEEPTLYEEDVPGPHFIEVRIGEDEPETEGLPARETTR
jgi:hypothetical protein